MLIPTGSGGSQSGLKHSEFDFHEQIYAWEPKEDVWLSLREADDQRKLSQLLVEAFSPDVPPDQRPISKLAEAIEAMFEVVKADGKSDWADNEETVETGGDEATLPELAVEDDPLLDLTHREGLEALRRAVQALPQRYREVVVLCDLEEVDYADAAIALGCPIGTVRSRLHRARALLLDKLKQDRNPRRAVTPLNPVRCMS